MTRRLEFNLLWSKARVALFPVTVGLGPAAHAAA